MNFILALALLAPGDGAIPEFKEQVVDPALGVGYSLVLSDINADGRIDIVVATEKPDQVVWFENPSWKKRPITGATPPLPVCLQPLDVDGDGKTEIILGADWPRNRKTGKSGTVWLLKRPDNLDNEWKPILIDEQFMMHRFRAMDPDGTGRKELVCSPLHGEGARGGAGPGAPLYLLRRPPDPFKGKWFRELITDEIHINHNVWPLDWDGDGREEILSAGYEGIFVLDKGKTGKWTKTKIGDGHPEKKGGGEVKAGRLPGGKRWVITVEPWHGESMVAYGPPAEEGKAWTRTVLVDGHVQGHALWAADLTGTGVDSLVGGFRGTGNKATNCVVYIFHPLDASGTKWEKKTLDKLGLGSEDIACADLNGDGKVDIVGIGRSTKNVKIYWNQRK